MSKKKKLTGKQFSKDYQPTNRRKWTEEKANKVLMELIAWLKVEGTEGNEAGNIFLKEFVLIEKDLPINILSYLSKQYESSHRIYETAKAIQEVKLLKWACLGYLNASLTRFVLKANFGYVERKESVNIEITRELSNETVKKLLSDNSK